MVASSPILIVIHAYEGLVSTWSRAEDLEISSHGALLKRKELGLSTAGQRLDARLWL